MSSAIPEWIFKEPLSIESYDRCPFSYHLCVLAGALSPISERADVHSGLSINVCGMKWGGVKQKGTDYDREHLLPPKILTGSETKGGINVWLHEWSVIYTNQKRSLFPSLYTLVFKKDLECIHDNVYVCLMRQELYKRFQ